MFRLYLPSEHAGGGRVTVRRCPDLGRRGGPPWKPKPWAIPQFAAEMGRPQRAAPTSQIRRLPIGRLTWQSRPESANFRFRRAPTRPISSRRRGRSGLQSQQSQQRQQLRSDLRWRPSLRILQKQTQANPLGLNPYSPARWAKNRKSKPIDLNSRSMSHLRAKNACFSRFLDEPRVRRARSTIPSDLQGSPTKTNGSSYVTDYKCLSSISAKQMVKSKPLMRRDLILKTRKRFIRCHQQMAAATPSRAARRHAPESLQKRAGRKTTWRKCRYDPRCC
jgi:hypothetical protein